MDVIAHNRAAWNKQVEENNEWTRPVTREQIGAARQGDWSVVLTGFQPVPRQWFPTSLVGCDILCLAGSGGQQAPIFAAAGANVTVLDLSPAQLNQDRKVAERDGLDLRTVEGDMRDLSVFASDSFDLVFHPVSNTFVPEVLPVWRECYRVLRKGGSLLAGFMNPIEFVFDFELKEDLRVLKVRYTLPYSDATSIDEDERAELFGADSPLEFSHTFDDQIGGQLQAGFVITGFYSTPHHRSITANYGIPGYFATRSVKT
jgi:SAM-dependent methyltransferase